MLIQEIVIIDKNKVIVYTEGKTALSNQAKYSDRSWLAHSTRLSHYRSNVLGGVIVNYCESKYNHIAFFDKNGSYFFTLVILSLVGTYYK